VGAIIPQQENYRTHFGRSLDLTRIDYSIRCANHGFMRPMTDLSRETVALDGHLSALLQKRLNRVAALDWLVEPAQGQGIDEGKAEAYATFVRHQLELLPNFRERIMDLAWGTFDGRAASELGWCADGRWWRIDDLHWIHPRRLSFGPNRDLRVVDSARDGSGFQPGVGFAIEEVPYKFVVHKPRMFGDYQEREGLSPRTLYWSFFCRFGTRERLALLELFGKPWRIVMPKGDLPHNTESLNSAFEQINALGAQSTARMPPGMEVQITQPQKGAGDVHDQTIDHAMKVLSKLVLGSTGTTDAVSTGLGSSIGDAHVTEEDLLIASDARRLAEAVESAVTDAMIAVNFGPNEIRHAPRFLLSTDPPLDRLQEGDRIEKALRIGIDVSLEEARQKMGFRELKEGEPFLRTIQRPSEPGMVAPPPAPTIIYPVGQAPPPGEITDTPFIGLNVPTNDNGPSGTPPPSGDAGPPPAGPPPEPPPDGGATAMTADEDTPDEMIEALAAKMTELGIVRCEHGHSNRCHKCGIERVRDVELADDGEPVWSIAWRPIRKPKASSPPALTEAARQARPITAGEQCDVDGILSAAIDGQSIEWRPELLRDPETTTHHACALHGSTVCLAVQPESVNGSPDTLVTRGVAETSASGTGAFARELVEAVQGKKTARSIRAAIEAAAKRFDNGKIAEPIERELLQGGMLGALDADFEAEENKPVAVESFTALHPTHLLAERDPRFAARPIEEAIRVFLDKEAVTRDVFDSMSKAAQRRAFTVARAANEEMVRTVKRELMRQLAIGADLADFGKNAVARFEAAGWTPANPSHVETIFRTNVISGYNGGRVRQMRQPEVLELRPFWQIMTVNDGPPRQRSSHQAVHGIVLAAADPFWQRATPPFGYNCRCRIRSISTNQGKDVVRNGGSIAGLPDPGFTSGIGTLL
jgi:phage gp29-like protein